MDQPYENMVIENRRIGESSSQYAYRVLSENIMYFKLFPGQALNDGALADYLGISRTPIREAFFRLREDGLINIHAKNKTIVSLIDYKQIKESLQIRNLLETSALKELCGKLTPGSQQRFEENLKIQKFFSEDPKLRERFFNLDNEFHKLIFLVCDREWTWRVLQKACAQLNRLRYINFISGNEQLEAEMDIISHLYQDHQNIFNALVFGDMKIIEDRVNNHIYDNILNKWKTPDSMLRQYIINIEQPNIS